MRDRCTFQPPVALFSDLYDLLDDRTEASLILCKSNSHMPITTQLRDNFIESVWHDDITTADLEQLLRAIQDFEGRLPVALDRLSDMSGAQALQFHSNYIIAMGQARQQAKLKNPVKSAIIATTPEQYGVARMFQTYNQNPDIHITIFRERLPAYEWLGITANSNDRTRP